MRSICLIIENSSLLSRNIAKLFFIERTRAKQDIKDNVLMQMESQKVRDEADIKTHVGSLIRYLNSENSHLKIRVSLSKLFSSATVASSTN